MTENNLSNKKQRFFNSNLTTTISISLVLFLVGLISLLMVLTKEFSNYVKESINFSIVLQDSISTEEFQSLKSTLSTASFVKESQYVTKAQAIKDLSAELGEDPQDLLGYNPLLASFEVKLHAKYANMDSLSVIEKGLNKFGGIKQIVYHKSFVELVNQNIKRITVVLIGLAFIFLLISIGLINNTIRLNIYEKRFNINTMQLVGATPWFIKKPFIWQSIRNGFVAAIIAIVLLGGLLYYVQTDFLKEINLLRIDIVLIISVVMIGLALILSTFAAIAAVNKYLRLETNELYYL
jgi:cell division transport system permease protein